jgi:hypothetical protein
VTFHQPPRAAEDMRLGALDVDLHDVDLRHVGEQLVKRRRFDRDALHRPWAAAAAEGGAATREFDAELKLERPAFGVDRVAEERDDAAEAVDEHRLAQLRQDVRIGLEGIALPVGPTQCAPSSV